MNRENSFEYVQDDAKRKVSEEIETFCKEIKSGTTDSDNLMTIFELEELWGKHRKNTSQIYSETLSEMLSSINQKDLIKSKKANTKKEG